ncbi:MAG TPA: DNA gyrase subunit A [Nitrospinota bacterium]|nr:DNA gyrase subunit A [Nitrospinota bacterium]
MLEKEKGIPINVEDEMKRAYLDYAMSVIVGRALPDVRDGLKPVHRRILYAMRELNLTWNKPFKKSARIVGDVIGKYHPHGDAAVYEAIVRMAQDFSMRYPLIEGQGNFGSIDGDPAAAMRYTEIRMSKIAQELLRDIEKDTVKFVPNYDNSLKEPSTLPSLIPNLLVNGSSGIAVGMATNIPPHCLGEVIEGLVFLIDNPDADIDQLMEHIKGPDFPTASFIHGKRGIVEAYKTGKGLIQLRARSFIEKTMNGQKESIIITELPYQVNKAKLIEKIAELVKDKKIEGISALRDESDREGMRIVVELRRNEIAKAVLNQLYKHTPMQMTFGVIMLALVNNQPKILNLKEILNHFIEFRRGIIIKRTNYELSEAKERAHILEGLKTAVENIDEVVEIIKKASSPEVAKVGLISKFYLSQIQAQAILDMRLQRLTGLEREKIIEDFNNTLRTIEELMFILKSEKKIKEIIKEELLEIKNEHQDERQTEIIEETQEIAFEDMITEEQMVVAKTHSGYVKRNPVALYKTQRRGGKGILAMGTKEEDFVEQLFISSTHNYMLFFTNRGRVYKLKVHEIPQAGRIAKGKAIVNLLSLEEKENITAMMCVRDFNPGTYLVMVTKKGRVKKTPLEAFGSTRTKGIISITLTEGDELIDVKLTNGSKNIFLGTRKGKSISFSEKDIRSMGRTSMGVRGIRIGEGDNVIEMAIIRPEATILSVTEKGFGKRTKADEYKIQSRGGKGLINIKLSEKRGQVVGIKSVYEDDELMIITSKGKIIRLKINEVSVTGRGTQGVRLIILEPQDRVVSLAKVEEKKDVGEEDTTN